MTMKSLIIKILLASGVLNFISLSEANEAIANGADKAGISTKGFPFGYVSQAADSGSSIDIASLASNWLFWAVVALVGFFVLRWVWDKFSRLAFYAVIIVSALIYFGAINIW